MLDAGLGARLLLQSLDQHRIIAPNKLQRDDATQLAVARLVDHTHAALTKQAQDLVALPPIEAAKLCLNQSLRGLAVNRRFVARACTRSYQPRRLSFVRRWQGVIRRTLFLVTLCVTRVWRRAAWRAESGLGATPSSFRTKVRRFP